MFVETYTVGWVIGAFWLGASIGMCVGFAVCALLVAARWDDDVAQRQVQWSEMPSNGGKQDVHS